MKNCLWIALLVLAGCATHRETAPQTYDFGLAQAPAAHTLSVQVPEMRAPEWLDGTAMLYRLAYRDPRALSPYSTSRWAGTPASMLTLRLRQQLGNLPGAKCQLATQLAEFSQTFDSASDSRALLQVQAVLHVAGTPSRRLQREFRLENKAATADAAGGAAAFSQLATEFVQQAGAWIAETGSCAAD